MEGGIPHRFVPVSFTSDALGANEPKVGDLAVSGINEYIFVYNAGNEVIPAGAAGVLSGVSGYSVTATSVAGADIGVGVAVVSMETGYYGYLQRRGFAQVEMDADASCVTGQVLNLHDDGGFQLVTTALANYAGVQAKAMISIASGASGTAYIAF
jgi:hypothetical protein